ncbi:hypothetical protein [Planctomyces sp. SH-PL62]|uniref:hypothetical protein n=1 Tax=Planctomyces sp. SH-PL62 TaxID=1636152 RepID=UPI00078B92E0|nr:hypothetical protein [Planctomyces sp. SH-PL62]AMV41050.1 hypothetical protein VT85_26680 [Planctomyces sp. SH-PL62]
MITVGEMVRIVGGTVGGEQVDVDLFLTTRATEGEMLARQPHLTGPGWVRRPSTLLADLILYLRHDAPAVPTGA